MNETHAASPQPPMPPLIRSWLFVPGNRADRFPKALASGADAVIIDLEDAVAPDAKDSARQAVVDHITQGAGQAGIPAFVRINALHSAAGLRDLLAICDAAGRATHPTIAGIMLPKVSCAEDITLVSDILDEADLPLEIGALIESVAGIGQAGGIARASDRMRFVMFGGADMALDLRVRMEWDALLSARSDVVRAAAGAGIDAVDMPWIDLDDQDGYARELQRSFGLGFTSRAAIHPTQIAAIHAALAPSDAAVAQARDVLRASQAAKGGVAILNGKLIEKPLVANAMRVLGLAAQSRGAG
jgi:(S)-citramalyl-CoA lyase